MQQLRFFLMLCDITIYNNTTLKPKVLTSGKAEGLVGKSQIVPMFLNYYHKFYGGTILSIIIANAL